MSHDRLEQLLRDADPGNATPAIDVDLAAGVRARAAWQLRVRAIGGTFAAAACLVATVAWVMRPDSQRAAPVIAHQPPPPTTTPLVPTPTAADERAEMLALAAEADRRAALAEVMWAAEPRPSRARSSAFDATEPAAQLERAAFTMVYQAARMPGGGGAASPAAGVYRQVWQTFPHTRSAAVARERLTELQTQKDG